MKTAVVSGASGQDGQILVELLARQAYRVIALLRPGSNVPPALARHGAVEVLPLDIRDREGLASLLARERPAEFYNLAALSAAGGQWDTALETLQVNGLAVVALLEALNRHSPQTRLCQASSCEMFGVASRPPQSELTPLAPDTPYAIAKAQAHHAVGAYRQKYALFACSAILFSHASELRSTEFLIGKVTRQAAEVARGARARVALHSLGARRDWGYAADYVRAMHAALQAPEPADYVVASGEEHSVEVVVVIDQRATVGVHALLAHVVEEGAGGSLAAPFRGDTARIRRELQWAPRVTFRDMIERITRFHLASLSGS